MHRDRERYVASGTDATTGVLTGGDFHIMETPTLVFIADEAPLHRKLEVCQNRSYTLPPF